MTYHRLYDLNNKTSAELAQAFAGIPVGVTTLDLRRNELDHKTGAELAQAFAGIPVGVTTLSLSNNRLYHKTGTELAQAFAGIPVSVTTLNLSGNYLGPNTGAELAQAFAGIPVSVTTLNLSGNYLGSKTGVELARAFAGIRPHVTISFIGSRLFVNKTHLQRDALLTKLRVSAPHLNIDLSHNGESDIQRALAPMACLIKKPSGLGHPSLNNDVINYTLSFLAEKGESFRSINKGLENACSVIEERHSQIMSDSFLLKAMFATIASLTILSVSVLILAGILVTPIAPMIAGVGLLAAGICVSGFFTYILCRDELVSEADVRNQVTP